MEQEGAMTIARHPAKNRVRPLLLHDFLLPDQ